MERDDWPFGDEPPWIIEDVKRWRNFTLSPNPANEAADVPPKDRAHAPATAATLDDHTPGEPISAERKAKLAIALERAALLRIQREILAGKHVPKDEAEQRVIETIHAVKSAMLALPRMVRQELANQPPEQIEAVLTARVIEMCNGFADSNSELAAPLSTIEVQPCLT